MAAGDALARRMEAGDQISALGTLAAACGIVARHALPFGIITSLLAVVNDGTIYLARRLIEKEPSESHAAIIESGGEMAGLILTTILGAIIGVAWFRIILLGEPHGIRAYLRFGRRELRYIGLDILFGIIVGAPFIVAGAFGGYAFFMMESGDMTWLESYVIPLAVGIVVWGAVCAAWLGLAYPAVATDVSPSSLKLSLRLSRGHRLPLFLAFLLGTGPWEGAMLATIFLAPEEAGSFRLTESLASFLSFWGGMCFLAVSAAAFRQLQDRSRINVAEAFD